jgi:hypothetical protein
MHGLQTHTTDWGTAPANDNITQVSTFITNLQNDGWVVLYVQCIGDNYLTYQNQGVFNEINNDAGNGSRYKTSIGWWWDHVKNYCNLNYPGWPVVPFGISMGGLFTLTVASTKASTIAAYGMQVPAALLWTAQGIPNSFVQSPVTAALSNTMNGLAFPQATITANASIPGGFASSGCIMIASTGSLFGFDTVRYTGISGANFTGCTGGITTHTMSTGGTIQQSTFTSGLDVSMTALNSIGNGQQGTVPVGYMGWGTIDSLIGYINAQTIFNNASGASAPVTSHAGPNDHQLLNNDISFITCNTWVSGGTYVVNQIVTNASTSYNCVQNISGSSTVPGSDLTHWNSITGGNTTQGWFQTTVDPLCPAIH